ncbi:ACP S-malonyltransferase, partial [Jannaschia sp.]|nr:ACP S-malonyltransferase [Jannaschia sp.]
MKAYLFPGQGSQHVGMGEDLFARFPDLVQEADAILGYSIADLCLTDADRKLTQTDFTQPALFVVNALTARQQRETDGQEPAYAAGHSIGEYNALHFAGALSFSDGLRLVQKRGALMATAPKGTMAAVIGPPPDTVRRILSDGGLDAVDIANLNSDKQTIISGLVEDIDRAQDVFAEAEGMFIPLNVGGAFHSRYMQPVADAFAAFLQGFTFAAPRLPVLANVDARPHDPNGIAASLARQLTAPVLWRDSMHAMLDAG